MASIVGVECQDGALLTGDRVRTRDGRIISRDADHLVDLDAVGAAAVGADPDRFADELTAAVRSYRLERGTPALDALVRMTADALTAEGMAVVAARDDEERPRVRAVDGEGALPADPVAARGSGTEFLLGALEFAEPPTLDAAEEAVESAFAAAAERDPATGAEIDRYRLE